MRSKKALMNTAVGLLQELVGVICSMILPRLILSTFGSSYNGITNSISQFISCIVLLRSGVGGVTRAALYKPLAENDNLAYSRVLRATEIYMRKIAMIFVAFLLVFAAIYPVFVSDEFGWLFASTLVLITGVSTFMQYYFGFTYQLILNADQRKWVISVVQIFTTAGNTLVAAILIKLGLPIHGVKIGSAVIFALNPLIINAYAHRRYNIIRGVEPDNQAVSQRWDSFAHQVANFVHSNVDTMVLTVMTNIRMVSVYAVHYLVINGMQRLVRNMTDGMDAAFGNMMAKGEHELMKKNFSIFETYVFSVATFFFTITGVTLVNFVMLYTKGITDADYYQPLFAVLITISAFLICVRNPYQHVVEAAGHFKQTKKGAFFEAGMNIVISVLSVARFGLVGVAFGTLAATGFRTVQYSTYLSKNIIPRSNLKCFWHLAISAGVAVLTVVLHGILPAIPMKNYFWWAVDACVVSAITGVLVLASDLVFFREDTVGFIQKLMGVFRKKKK